MVVGLVSMGDDTSLEDVADATVYLVVRDQARQARVWSTLRSTPSGLQLELHRPAESVYSPSCRQPDTIAQHEGNWAADVSRVRGRRAATVGLDLPAATVGRLIGAAARQPTSGWTQAARWCQACYLGSSTEFQ